MKKISRLFIIIVIYGGFIVASFLIIKKETNNTSVPFFAYMFVMILPLLLGLMIAMWIMAIRGDWPEEMLQKRMVFLDSLYVAVSLAFFFSFGYRMRSTISLFPIVMLIGDIRRLYIIYKKKAE